MVLAAHDVEEATQFTLVNGPHVEIWLVHLVNLEKIYHTSQNVGQSKEAAFFDSYILNILEFWKDIAETGRCVEVYALDLVTFLEDVFAAYGCLLT